MRRFVFLPILLLVCGPLTGCFEAPSIPESLSVDDVSTTDQAIDQNAEMTEPDTVVPSDMPAVETDVPPDAPTDVPDDVPVGDQIEEIAPDLGPCDGTCMDGEECCAEACVDVQIDAANCGECGVECLAGENCTAGACQCGSEARCGDGTLCCGDACIDPSLDTNNCGGCGIACAEGETCDGGVCACAGGPACTAGEACCSGSCIDVQDDAENCGACERSCGDGFCRNGGCRCGMGPECAGSCCGEMCVDHLLDNENCGGCGVACGEATCTEGACVCDVAGETVCDGICVDLQASDQHCGACGVACLDTTSCIEGSCAYPLPLPDSVPGSCIDAAGMRTTTCAMVGEALYGQDGNYDFSPRSLRVNGDLVVDEVTGLRWSAVVTNSDAPGAITHCNGLVVQGVSDFRLPTIPELVMLYDPMNPGWPVGFSGQDEAFSVRSSSDHPNNVDDHSMFFSDGSIDAFVSNANASANVICVSDANVRTGGEFTFDAQGTTATDTRSGLQWTKSSQPDGAQATFGDALGVCESSTVAGFDDWRVPTYTELYTTLALDGSDPTYRAGFNLAVGNHWTSTSAPDGSVYVVNVGTGKGQVFPAGSSRFVVCVRDL